MGRVVIHRLLLTIPLLFIVSAVTFIVEALTPGSAADVLLGTTATPAQVARVTTQLRLNRPIYVQYWDWLSGAVHGNFGVSLFSQQSVVSILWQRLPVTISLVVPSIVLIVVIGVLIGVVAAVRGGRARRFLDAAALSGFAVPNFWLALILIAIFGLRLGWFPATGYESPGTSLGGWISSLALPVAAIAAGPITVVAQQTTDAMTEVMNRPFIRSLEAYGLPRWSVIFRHALRNAATPILTVSALLFIGLLSGTVFVEQIFGLPGLGGEAVQATGTHDVAVVQGIAIYFAIAVVVVNLLVDLAALMVDPRQRTRHRIRKESA
jgi:peptide/nickel transport system permease protein